PSLPPLPSGPENLSFPSGSHRAPQAASTAGASAIPVRPPARLRSWMNWLIMGATCCMFLLQLRDPTLLSRWQLSARSIRLWMFLSYAFVHLGWMHLLSNLAALMVFGPNINRALGQAGYLGFYLGGAIAAGAGFIAAGGA